MVFSLGNIITIIIVILILAIYRQMDRNNRSLEKIRRYSDKITGDLDRFVDDKTAELKNVVIELDVHQTTGREILKRITASEEDLQDRAVGIQEIADRIGHYDQAISNLVTLTSTVDENMKRLKDESAFVDDTGKNLKNLRVRLEGIEKQIPGIVDDFTVLNTRELEASKTEVMLDAERRSFELGDEIKRASQDVEDFTRRMDDIDERWEQLDNDAFSKLETGFKEILDSSAKEGVLLKDSFESNMKDSLRKLMAYHEKLKTDGAAMESAIQDKVKNMSSESAKLEAGITTTIEKAHQETKILEASFTSGLADAAAQGRELSDEVFGELKTYIAAQSQEVETNMNSLVQQEQERMSKSTSDLRTVLDDEIVSIKDRYQELEQGIEVRMGEMEGSVEADQAKRQQELSSFMEVSRQEIEDLKVSSKGELKRLETQAGQGLQELEQQVGSYEEEINYRISRVERVGDEISELDKNLRQTIDRMMVGVREEFSAAREDMIKHIDDEGVVVRQRVSGVNQDMSALEKELDELKARAYDNVNEKLQVFEDDFFKDLREREENIRSQFSDWQDGLGRELEQMGADHGSLREQLSTELSDSLRDRLATLQNKTFQQYEKYEDQVSNYQDRINERISLSEKSLDGLEESLKNQTHDIRQNSQVEFEKDFTEHKTGVEAVLNRWEREWEVGVKEQEEKMVLGFRDLRAGMDSANSDVTVWQTQAQQRLTEISADVEERYANLKTEADSTVENINKDFVEQRDAFDSFYLDLQKRSKDLEIAIEQKLRDFRAASGEIREKVDSVQLRLFGKIEDQSKALTVNIQEIDKQQKNFIAQTKIFDRADSLKMSLQENIEDLKVEIARITVQSKEIKEAERKFLTIKKMNDEVSSKLSRFLTEKRRLEEMEGDFKKLINLSQSIDIKLDQVTTTHDALQEVQVRIRSLEELEGEVLQKYERLEKKGSVLEATTEHVDKNFHRLTELESGLKGIENAVSALAPQVSEVGAQVKVISKERAKTTEAIKLINGLDNMITDIEDRTERMQKAREWLAGTETRLEEVNREAQEQVKLLGSLVKDGGLAKQGKSSSMGARDVVGKLAAQGWSVEEIARTTKLSRGEVELILELRK